MFLPLGLVVLHDSLVSARLHDHGITDPFTGWSTVERGLWVEEHIVNGDGSWFELPDPVY